MIAKLPTNRKAMIFRPSKSAMQSGQAKAAVWRVVFAPRAERFTDPVMGWVGNTDMDQEIRMTFATQEQAVAYCEQAGIEYEVEAPKDPKRVIKSYADNFK